MWLIGRCTCHKRNICRVVNNNTKLQSSRSACSGLLEHSGNTLPKDEVLIMLFDAVVILFCTGYRVLTSIGKHGISPCQQNKQKSISILLK